MAVGFRQRWGPHDVVGIPSSPPCMVRQQHLKVYRISSPDSGATVSKNGTSRRKTLQRDVFTGEQYVQKLHSSDHSPWHEIEASEWLHWKYCQRRPQMRCCVTGDTTIWKEIAYSSQARSTFMIQLATVEVAVNVPWEYSSAKVQLILLLLPFLTIIILICSSRCELACSQWK